MELSRSYSMGLDDTYADNCFGFAVTSVITILVVTFNLISEWYLHGVLDELDIPKRIRNSFDENSTLKEIVWRYSGIYLHITDIYFYTCIASTCLAGLQLFWFVYTLCAERKKFKEKRDGVPYRETVFERYAFEILIFVSVLVQDVLVSGILFCLQAGISCKFYIDLENMHFLLVTSAIVLHTAWKFVLITWNSGCFGTRTDYHNNCAICGVRLLSIFCMIGALVIICVNFILFPKPDSHGVVTYRNYDNTVWDKVTLDYTANMQKILFRQTVHEPLHSKQQAKDNLTTVALLKQVIHPKDLYYVVEVPCAGAGVTFPLFFDYPHFDNNDMQNCTVTFEFEFLPKSMQIFYNYHYKFFDSGGECFQGTLTNGTYVRSISDWLIGNQTVHYTDSKDQPLWLQELPDDFKQHRNVTLYHTVMYQFTSEAETSQFNCYYDLVLSPTLSRKPLCQ